MVRAETDQGAQRREQQRHGHHDRHQRCGHMQFHDHHAIERANEQYQRHAHRDLEKRQA
jgi:hypothetical protein